MGDSYPPEWVETLDAPDKLDFDHIIGGHGSVKPKSPEAERLRSLTILPNLEYSVVGSESMRNEDLERLKADLATMKEIAGVTDAPQREDVVTASLIGASGLCCGLWTLLTPTTWHLWGLLAVAMPVAHLILVRLRNGADRGGSPRARAEFAESVRLLLLAIPFSAYSLWALHMKIPPRLVLATGVFFTGTLMVGALIGTARRYEVLPYCVAFMVAALALPATSLPPLLVIASMLAGSGLCSAAWLAWGVGAEERHGLAD
jgi:hypothetical protein